jgi:hypothetical protein
MIEAFAVMFYVYSVFLGGMASFFTFIYLFFTNYYWLPLAYLIWLKFDGNTEHEVFPKFFNTHILIISIGLNPKNNWVFGLDFDGKA